MSDAREDRTRYLDLSTGNCVDEYRWEGEGVPRVYDFHRTVNLFEAEEWNEMTKELAYPIILLSFVGFAGQTRVKVEANMPKYNAAKHFLCFIKKGNASHGTKGYFMKGLTDDPSQLVLVDDRVKNCNSAKAAGCQTIRVFSKEDVIKSL